MSHPSAWWVRGFIVLIALCVSALAAPHLAHGQDAPAPATSWEAYRAAVRDAAALLESDPAHLDEARRRLAPFVEVELRSGARVPVAPLLDAGDGAGGSGAAQARLRTVVDQLDIAQSDQTAARLAALDAVLAGAAFQQQESLLDRLRRWLTDLFAQWGGGPAGNASPGPISEAAAQVVGWIVAAGAAVTLLFVLARWLQTLLRSFVGDVAARRDAHHGLPATPAAARAAATRAAQGGDYRGAVRQLYLAALLTLQERRVVARDPSLTNREVLARLPAAHPAHAPLQAVVAVFDEVWYGVYEPDRATFEQYRAAVDELDQRAATPDERTKEGAQ